MANTFKGFPDGDMHFIPLPDVFFQQLLPLIDNLNELKLTVYTFYRLDAMEGSVRYLRRSELMQDPELLAALDPKSEAAVAALNGALAKAVKRGTLLAVTVKGGAAGSEVIYFLNSPRGQAAIKAIQSGQWHPDIADSAQNAQPPEIPNIFRLYEENIGPLTPLMAETLGEAQDTYPAEWIVDAIRIAVERNKRTWRYISAILERWQREGKHDRKEKTTDRPDSAESRRKYIEGDYSEYIKH